MATLVANDSGYTASSSSSSNNAFLDDSDLYHNNKQCGILKFTTSVNSLLGTSASDWSQINFTKATVTLRSRETLYSDANYWCKASHVLTKKGVSIDSVAGQVTGWGVNQTAYTTTTVNLLPMFQSMTSSYGFTPNTSTWYLYFTNTTHTTAKRWYRLSQRNGSLVLTLEGKMNSNCFYYNGISWIRVMPNYYTGFAWQKSGSNYYDGASWKKC